MILAIIPPAVAKEKVSWVGKTVLTKTGGVKGGYINKKGEVVYSLELSSIFYKVIRERKLWVSVRDRGNEVRLRKREVVLLENAIDFFTDRIEAKPKDNVAYAYRAVAWILRKKYGMAIKDFSEAIRHDPTSPIWYNNRGNAYAYKKDFDRAIKDYKKAIRLDPKYASAFNNRGGVYRDMKDYDRAIKDYNRAIRLDPKYTLAYVNRGIAYAAKKDYDQAIKDYKKAIRLDPKYAITFSNRGSAYEAKKKYDRAIKDYTEAIRLDPTEPSSYDALAELLSKCINKKYRDGKKAVEYAKKACKLTKWKNASYIATLSAAYSEAGDIKRAIVYHKVAQDIEKQNRKKSRK
jgi:tetratricopeptide (TPR) repeat protein